MHCVSKGRTGPLAASTAQHLVLLPEGLLCVLPEWKTWGNGVKGIPL